MAPGGMNDRIPARLNCIFKMRITRGDLVYRLAHATLTTIVGGRRVKNDEGMFKVYMTDPPKNVVVRVADIAGMAHLIPLEPDQVWYINNRIDLHTWNMVYVNE